MFPLNTPYLPPTLGPGLRPEIANVFFDDFNDGLGFLTNNPSVASSQGKFSELANMGNWLVTVVDGGGDNGETIVQADDEPGGVITFTTNDANNDGLNIQLNGEAFKVASEKDIFFGCRFKIPSAITTLAWFVGLAETDTTILAGTTERIGFGSNGLDAGDASIFYFVEDASTETSADTGVDLVADTFVDVNFHVRSSGHVVIAVDGAKKAQVTTNIPVGDAMTLSIALQNDAAAATAFEVDYILCCQSR